MIITTVEEEEEEEEEEEKEEEEKEEHRGRVDNLKDLLAAALGPVTTKTRTPVEKNVWALDSAMGLIFPL